MSAGQLTTFHRLLNDESMIIIPKVQRDYAYGRLDDKAPFILDNLLTTMHEALRHDRRVIFDFVYGGAYERTGAKHAGMIPLDGQQRLTTLFLLHFYASVIQDVPDEEVRILERFRYETRQSANEFGQNLVGPIRRKLLQVYGPGKKISDIIRDNELYSPAYAGDPTISSMLVALDAIEDKFRTFRQTRFRRKSIGLWTALTTHDNLCFYHITLDRFGLTDDLYIKMNSRGKKLTTFEIFKADLEQRVRSIDESRVDDMARRIDTEWIDMVWNQHLNDPAKTDVAYMTLINNILRLICSWKKGIEPHDDPAMLATAITDAADIDTFTDILSAMHDVYKRGFEPEWERWFYHAPSSQAVIGRSDRIRLFGQGPYAGKCIFIIAMEHRMSNPEMVQFLAYYLVGKSSLDTHDSLMALRLARNLITANQRANNFRAGDVPRFLADIEHIVDNLTGAVKEMPPVMSFVSTAVDEERLKLTLATDDYDRLLKYENHSVLNGSTGLFIEHYIPAGTTDCSMLFNRLSHFEKVFDNNCMTAEGFEKIRVNLLDPHIDYWQWEAGDEQDDGLRRRFIHNPDDYTQFLTSNSRRRNQHAILDIIANLPEASLLRPGDRKCGDFNHGDYRYYMAKYYASNSPGTKYGYYGWHDYTEAPLDAYILNSSYFGSSNLAWNMMLHILHDRFYRHYLHGGNMTWDQHQAPLHFTKTDVVTEFRSAQWILTTASAATAARFHELSSILPITVTDDGVRTTCLIDVSCDSRPDFIQCAMCVIESVTNRFALMPRGWRRGGAQVADEHVDN